MFEYVLILILTTISLISNTNAAYFTQQCPTNNCTCDISSLTLTISCTQKTPYSFQLPYYQPDLSQTQSIRIYQNKLYTIPSNLCQFQTYLRILDISSNQINDSLTPTTLTCLNKLEFLNATSNQISIIDTDALILPSLVALDLSYNQISYLPIYLFSETKVPNLKYILLNNNLITEIDVWFILLPSIIRVDLSSNRITKFINRIGYKPSTQVKINITTATQINLRNNLIKKFDDSILNDYYLCVRYFDLSLFLNYLSPVLLDQNPFDCSCSSYNLLQQYQFLVNSSLIKTSSILYKAACNSPSIYLSRSIFSFTDYSTTCANSQYATNVANCITTTTTTTLKSVSIQNPNNPELLIGSVTNQPVIYDLTDGQIGGIVIGFLGALILLFVLLYCICPIEILACVFNMFPSFYSLCPCKSGVVTNKKYDLFISYNQTNEDWIRKKFLPFLKQKNPIRSYFLQYGELNLERDDFNDIIRDAMENSGCILLVLSDAYLMNEWSNEKFKSHLRYLLTKVPKNQADKHRLVCVQMYDVCDEEVDDYVRHHLQLPRFISLETDEFYFWQKLAYYLHTNNIGDVEKILPVNYTNVDIRLNDNIDFKHYNIKAPIVHVPPKVPNTQDYILDEKYKNVDTKRQAAILNKQRIKISKRLLPKSDRSDLINDDDSQRNDSPTDLVPEIINKKRNTRIILGKLSKTNDDTKIKVKREQLNSIEFNVVKEEVKNVNYSINGDHDYTAEVKNSLIRNSLKQKMVTFNNDKNVTVHISNKNETTGNESKNNSIEKNKVNKKSSSESSLDDYEAVLNEIESNSKKNETKSSLGKKKPNNNNIDDSDLSPD